MASINTFRCDECGIQKQETNHWFLANPMTPAGVAVTSWVESESKHDGMTHLCGQSCVHAAMDRWMTTGKLEKQ